MPCSVNNRIQFNGIRIDVIIVNRRRCILRRKERIVLRLSIIIVVCLVSVEVNFNLVAFNFAVYNRHRNNCRYLKRKRHGEIKRIIGPRVLFRIVTEFKALGIEQRTVARSNDNQLIQAVKERRRRAKNDFVCLFANANPAQRNFFPFGAFVLTIHQCDGVERVGIDFLTFGKANG